LLYGLGVRPSARGVQRDHAYVVLAELCGADARADPRLASIATGKHTLMLAPTGSGKTLAAFLWCLDRLARTPGDGERGTRVVYVSPIKALAYDVERNLRAPLAGLQRLGAGAQITVDVRTGDTPAKERERQRKDPGQILITTPESLYLLLAGRSRDRLRTVETVIVDEIHALAPTKRGIHLALTLERLAYLVTSAGNPEPQRIGLSATQRPLMEVARYLGGDRPVEIIDASARPALDLEIVVPVADMEQPPPPPPPLPQAGKAAKSAVKADDRAHVTSPKHDAAACWPLIIPRLLDEILAHRSTIVFVNSRRLAERVAQQLSDLAVQRGVAELPRATAAPRTTGAPPSWSRRTTARSHATSASRSRRHSRAGACARSPRPRRSSSASTWGAVDLVIQVESPGAGVARLAAHRPRGPPRRRHQRAAASCRSSAAICSRRPSSRTRCSTARSESIRVPDSALDVLAQQIVAMVAADPCTSTSSSA